MFKKLEQDIRHGIQKTSLKIKLDSARDSAREALEEAEQGVVQINQITALKKAQLEELTENFYLKTHQLTATQAQTKLKEAHIKLALMGTFLDKILLIQKAIIAQKNITQLERGKVSHIPNEAKEVKQAELQGKEASQKAQEATETIRAKLIQVQPELANFQIAINEYKDLIQVATEVQEKQVSKTKILIETIRSGDIKEVKNLIEQEEADVNLAIGEQTALHIASLKDTPNSEALIIYLLTQGADPKARDFNHWTPIHYAIYTKNQEALMLYSDNHLMTEEHQQFADNSPSVIPNLTPSLPNDKETNKVDYKKVAHFLTNEYQTLFKKAQQLEEENKTLKKAIEHDQPSSPPIVYLQSLSNSIPTPEKAEEPPKKIEVNKPS